MAVPEAYMVQDGEFVDYTPTTAKEAGDVVQHVDGRAGVVVADIAAGVMGSINVRRGVIVDVAKAADIVIIEGDEIWWDHSANAATNVPRYGAADKDFYLGVAQEDVVAAGTDVKVALNEHPVWAIDSARDYGDTILVLTAGTPDLVNRGGMMLARFSLTAEAQKVDWFSDRSFPLASNFIFCADVVIVETCDADVGDLSIGVANATHASDFDSVTESAIFHYDLGADTNIDAESDDGTVEVAATDTTKDFAAGTPHRLVIDGRDPTNLKYYVDSVEVLAATANLGDIRLATGPLKAAFHLEKTSNDSPGQVAARLRVRFNDENE